MKNRTYIPGFDYARLLGCLLITLNHTYLNEWVEACVPKELAAIFGEVVPMFFLMSGYLMYEALAKKEKPGRYVCSYVIKYGLIFYVISFLGVLRIYLNILGNTGTFFFKSLVMDMILLPCYFPPSVQLWFIPPLLAGILVNSYIFLRQKEKKWLPVMGLYGAVIILFNIYGGYFNHFPAFRAMTHQRYFQFANFFVYRTTWGIVYVFMGMWISKHRDRVLALRIKSLLLPLVLFTGVELLCIFRLGNPVAGNLGFNFSTCIWSVVILMLLLRVKGGSTVRTYHREIGILSGLTYFLHIDQNRFLLNWFENGVIRFFLIMGMNIALTWVVLWLMKGRKGRKQHGL